MKSSVGIGTLLMEGIGDTVRVSVTGDPVQEVGVALAILEACGLRDPAPDFISCRTCGRTEVDLPRLASAVESMVRRIKAEGGVFRPSKIAVMGCAVNGPVEAKDADLGLAGASDGRVVVFKEGEAVGCHTESEALEVFEKMLGGLLA